MGKDEATRKFNLSLPEGLMGEFYRLTGAGKRGQKLRALTAAVLMFCEADPKTADEYLGRVGAAQATKGGFDDLLTEAKAARKPQNGRRGRLSDPGGVRKATGGSHLEERAPA